MTYDDLVVLIKPTGQTKDKYKNVKTEYGVNGLTQALCSISSVTRQEFYVSKQTEYKPSLVITLDRTQYDNQHYLFFGNSLELERNIKDFIKDGILYGVIRVYQPNKYEIELTLEEKQGNDYEEMVAWLE